jgi:quercetin dioxygenase-like cupin family protein
MTERSLLHVPAVLPPQTQRAVWSLGALIRVRAGGDATGGALAVLEHQGERGYSSPLHRHNTDEETFLMLEGELLVQVDGQSYTAGPGTAAVLPRKLPHAFLVTSPRAVFLTIHAPAGFDGFALAAGTPADPAGTVPTGPPPDPMALAVLASRYGIEILGPPPAPPAPPGR